MFHVPATQFWWLLRSDLNAHSPSKRLFCGDPSPRTDLSPIIAAMWDDVVKNPAPWPAGLFPLV